ncbi:MAG TPA: sensor histidine kinase, partial [Ktedonobacteraceae bacterium]|nr:sensor histidine kinase [Ktedonobacteraceae bacterium]
MQETIQKREPLDLSMPPMLETSQGSVAILLGISHLVASAVALGLSFLLMQFHMPLFSVLLIALPAALVCGLLCTVNLQYNLHMLELAFTRLIYDQSWFARDQKKEKHHAGFRWPLAPFFLRFQEIERRIAHYISREQLTADLREKASQQAAEAAALAERNRIARDLHDSIKQQIFSISVSAATAKALLPVAHSDGDTLRAVEDIQRDAREAQVEMQALLQQLRPAPLENTSLIEALHVQAQALSFRTGAQVHVKLEALPAEDRLLPGTQEAIFRLVQEAFANSARHARARTIWLEASTLDQTLLLEVRDDGQGFDTSRVQSGMGLNNLRERTKELHGNVEIISQPAQGTTVLITIPLLDILGNPAEEARRRYELAHFNELARKSYDLCSNASTLTAVIGLVSFVAPLPLVWSLGLLGGWLIAISAYAFGFYYGTRIIWNVGRDNQVSLELAQYRHKVGLDLARLLSLGILYVMNLLGPLHATQERWLLAVA